MFVLKPIIPAAASRYVLPLSSMNSHSIWTEKIKRCRNQTVLTKKVEYFKKC